MSIKEIVDQHIGEKYYEISHSSGLHIFVFPKEDYKTTYAAFGTKYGSIDTCFKRSDKSDYTTVPEGIAHFLEHKLFESEEQDAFERFAKTGANANAYTSFDKTCYIFSCTDNVEQSLEILLDFVQHPYFTKETVEKEQGIIGQEIRMYDDDASWMVMFNLLRCLYHSHPVRIDIAGTTESISHISDQLLYDCYNTFYNLNNMALCVAGNVDVEKVVKICDKMLVPAEPLSIERSFEKEPDEIVKDFVEYNLAVPLPVFALGYKEKCEKPEPAIRDIIETNILIEVISGDITPLYKELFEKGLINTSFGGEYFTGYGFESILFQGESTHPELVVEAIKAEIERIRKDGIDSGLFEAARKKFYGLELMSYNDVDSIANGMISCYFSGMGLFDSIESYKNVTVEDIEKRLQKMMDESKSALSVVHCKED